jgi:hypothetical protein
MTRAAGFSTCDRQTQIPLFLASTDDGCIDVFFGNHGTTFELPFESGLPKDAGLDSIMQWAKEMGLAVLAGKCRERAGFLGVRGTIWVKEKLTV